jgi:transcriptional regulator with XRE-family HTH domain
MRKNLRQADLAEALGHEQGYISALELGLKKPTDVFIERLIKVLSIPEVEQKYVHRVVNASQRKLVIDSDAPSDIFWLLEDLRDGVQELDPRKIRMIREIIRSRTPQSEVQQEPVRRLKRRRKTEATM